MKRTLFARHRHRHAGHQGRAVRRHGRTALATAFRKSRLHRPAPGVVEEDPEHQFRSVCQCIRACVAEAGDRSGAEWRPSASTGRWRASSASATDGRHVTPYDSWLDTRCSPYIALMQERGRRRDHPQDGRAGQFQSRPQDPLVEARASRGLRADRRVRAARRIRGDAAVRPGGIARRSSTRATCISAASPTIAGLLGRRRFAASSAFACGQAAADRRSARGCRRVDGCAARAMRAQGRHAGHRRLRRHGGVVPGLRRDARGSLRRCGGHGLGVCGHHAAVPCRHRASDAGLGAVGHAGLVASLRLHQRRRHEPRMVRARDGQSRQDTAPRERSTGSTGWRADRAPDATDPIFCRTWAAACRPASRTCAAAGRG